MTAIILQMKKDLKENSDEKTKKSGQNFFKEKVKLYGVKTSLVKRIGKEYFRKVLDIYAEPRQPVEYLSKSNNTSTVNKPSNSVSAPSRNFRETISQVPYINPMTGETETRVVLRTPKDEFMMNLEQYGKLGADSIPKEGNYIFKRRTYARGG